MNKNLFNTYPLHLVFMDEELTSEQCNIFLERFNFKHIEVSMRIFEVQKFGLVNLTKNFFDFNLK